MEFTELFEDLLKSINTDRIDSLVSEFEEVGEN